MGHSTEESMVSDHREYWLIDESGHPIEPYYSDFKNYKEEASTPMTKDALWEKITAPWGVYPALSKAIFMEAEVPIGEEVVEGDYTFQLGTGLSTEEPIVAFARTGDWGNIEFATNAGDLPNTDAASH